MALFDDDVLNPDPRSGLDPRRGLNLFKTSEQAYQEDVVPRSNPQQVQLAQAPSMPAGSGRTLADTLGIQDVLPAQPQGGSAQSAPRTLADALGINQTTIEQPAEKEQGNFSRGFEVAGRQLKQTAYGTAALIGDSLGSDKLRTWGLKGYEEGSEEIQAISKSSDSFTNAIQEGELGQWFSYSMGYLLGQFAEIGAAGVAGAVAGSAIKPGAGTIAGGVTGAVSKGAVQTGLKKKIGDMVDKEAKERIARGVAKDVAAQQALASVYRNIGATTAVTFLNATQILGSTYGEAVEQAIETGEDYSLGRVWLAGMAATAVDSWADSKALRNFVKAIGGDRQLKGMAMEALKGGFREGITEGIQEALQNWGAKKDVMSQEAYKQYIDAAAVGFLGGSIAGGTSGAINKLTAPGEPGAPALPTQGNDITTPQSDRNPNRPNVDNLPGATRSQAVEALKDGPTLAYLYQTGTEQDRKNIELAAQRFGSTELLDQVKDSKQVFDNGAQKFAGFEEDVTRIRDAIGTFAQQSPQAGTFKAPPRRPMTEQERLAELEAANEQFRSETLEAPPGAATQVQETQTQAAGTQTTQTTQNAAQARRTRPQSMVGDPEIEAAVQQVEQQAGQPDLTTEQTLPDTLRGARVTDQNRQVLEMFFQEQADTINARRPSKSKEKALDRLAGQMQMVGFTQEEIDRISNPKDEKTTRSAAEDSLDQPAPPSQPTEIAQATRNLQDAGANLFDVLTDIGGQKMNIRGQQRTVSELPAALSKVMQALVELGYVKFKDVVRELMKRMKASKEWGPLSKSVTPAMLRQAYNGLPAFKGKESAEAVAAVTREELAPLVKGEAEQKAAPQEVTLQDEIRDVQEQIELENQRLNEKYGSVDSEGKPIDWTQARLKADDEVVQQAISDMSRLEGLKTQLRVLVDEEKEEAQFAKGSLTETKSDPEDEAPETDMGTYKAKPKVQKPQTPKLTPTQITPNMREYLGSLSVKDQKDAQKRFAEMTAEERTQWENRYKANKERVMAGSQNEPGQQSLELTKPQRDERVKELEREVNAIMNLSSEAGVWRDAKKRIEDAIAEIDQKLMEARSLFVGNKRFEAVNESDENAYLWGDQGFRIAKNLPQDKLLAIRRSLNDDLQAIRQQSARGMAALFYRSIRKIDYDLSLARSRAISQGLPAVEADAVLEPSRRFIADTLKQLGNRKDIDKIYDTEASLENRASRPTDMTDEEFLRKFKLTDDQKQVFAESRASILNAIQEDMDAGRAAAFRLVGDLKEGRIKPQDALRFAQQAMQAKEFTFGELTEAMKASGFDIPQQMFEASGQVALQTRMVDYVQSRGDHSVYREEWLRSMDTLVKRNPRLMDNFTQAERTAYELWSDRRRTIAERRKADDVMMAAQDVETAFPDLLFAKYSLSQMRNPSSIPARELAALRSMVGDLEQAWFQDVAFALQTRRDLADQIIGEDGVIAPTEAEQYKQWVARHKAAIEKDAEVNAKAPYLRDLMGFSALPQEAYDKYRTNLLAAQMAEAPVILANAQRLNDMLASQQNLTQADVDGLIDGYMDNMVAEEGINGQTIEEFFGVREYGTAQDMRDESVNDLANTDEGFEFSEGDVEVGQDAEGNPILRDLRLSQVQPRFFSGVLSAAQVQATVARITQNWKGAPKITVVRNVAMLPAELQARIGDKLGAGMDARGLYDAQTGEVYLFSDVIGSEAETEFTLFHEVYGHVGMRALFGAKFDQFLNNMYNTYPGVRASAEAKMADGMGKLEATEEALADLAGENNTAPAFKQFVGRVIAGLREIGLNAVANWMGNLTNAELSYHLASARDVAQNGGYAPLGTDIRFSQTENVYEVFAQRGGKTKAYARFNPVTQSWILFRAMGADIRDNDGYNVSNHDSYEDVVSTMQRFGKLERRKRSGFFVDEKIPTDMPDIVSMTNVTGMKRWMRDQITRFQNEYKPIFDVVDALRAQGRITDEIDVKSALTLYERRAGAVVEDFREKFVQPIMKLVEEAGQKGASYDDINYFLLARHAEERNKQIARINTKMPDGGSGMFTEEAQNYLNNELPNKPYLKELQEIGRKFDQMSKAKIDYLVRTGMISSRNYVNAEGQTVLGAAELMSKYKHYVNLSGQRDGLDKFEDISRLVGTKFNVKGREKRAMGRESMASDIMANTILGMEAALIRGQKNIIAQKIVALFEANYDPNFAVIGEVAYKQQIGEDGMVQDVEDESYISRKDVMVAKIRGIPVTIKFKDTTRGSFADAIHGMVYPAESNAFMESLGQFNRVIGQMLTTYNPAWALVNFTRDAQTMYFNAAADGRITKDQAAQMVKLLPKTIKVAYFMASNRNSSIKVDPELVATFQEMKREGGMTLFLNRQGLEDQVGEIEKLLRDPTAWNKTKDKFTSFLKLAEHITIPMEIAPRLAAYKVARDGGMSIAEAAAFSGEITVNFNMRGSNKAMRQLFLFFNPAVQGSAKIIDVIRKNPKRASGYITGLIALGALSNIVARATGDDDEAGINDLDKIPLYKRATSITIIPGVPGASIPLPYGWNAFFALGHFMTDTALGIQPLTRSAKRAAEAAFESFSPMGTAGLDSNTIVGTVAKGLAPTAVLPIVEWMANENRFGAPIYRDDSLFGGAKLPNSESAFRSVSPISQGIARSLNELTGGNRAASGAVDVNPAAIDFLISSYLPGMITEVYRGASAATRIARGEEVKSAPLPIIDRFTAKVPVSYDAGAFRRARELVETRYREYQLMPERRDAILEELPGLLRARAVVSGTSQEIRQVRANFDKFERRTDVPRSEIVERKNRMMERERLAYNRAVRAVMEAGPEFRDAILDSN